MLKVVNKILVTSNTSYATGKVIGGLQTVTDGVLNTGGVAKLKSIALANKNASTNVALDIIFFDAAVSCGADAASFAITAAESLNYLGHVNLVAGDYTLNGAVTCLATKILSEGLLLKAAAGKNNTNNYTLYFVVVARATNVIASTADVQVKLGFDQAD